MQTSGHTGTKMTRDWKQWEGQVVNGAFPLRQYLGGSDLSALFVTERRGPEPQRAALKLIVADQANSEMQLARWESSKKLTHPHLLRLFETGRCHLGNVALLYIVMEYADENLAQILPHRPLTTAEAREMLEPALDALAYIHGKSLVHGGLKPANIMAVRDQLKLSSDRLGAVGDRVGGFAKPSVYDAPEVASGKISAASDCWSLGMTLMESLTQRLPTCEGMAEPVLETVSAPFMGIAHCCLRRDAHRRCSAADIAARLRSTTTSSHEPARVKPAAASPTWRYVVPIAAVVLTAAALLFGPRLFSPEVQPVSSVSSEPSSEGQDVPSKPESTPTTTETKPSARKPGTSSQSSSVSARSVESAPASETGEAAQGPVLQQILPSVSKSARDTIHGTIKVRVRVAVDPSGDVETATFITPGPSKYFARQAMQAAQQWKFVPAQGNGQEARTWILRFGFKRSGTDAAVEPAKP